MHPYRKLRRPLHRAVEWVGDPNIICPGVGTGLVIASFAAYGALHLGKNTDGDE